MVALHHHHPLVKGANLAQSLGQGFQLGNSPATEAPKHLLRSPPLALCQGPAEWAW